MSEAARLTKILCRRFEGLRLRPYFCPAMVASIGYGATSYLDGRAVQIKDPAISLDTAERLLDRTVRTIYLPAAIRQCPTANTFARLAALADFAFNLGPTRLKSSTLRKRVLANDWEGAQVEVRKWVRAGGRVLPGLVLRCEARVALMREPEETP